MVHIRGGVRMHISYKSSSTERAHMLLQKSCEYRFTALIKGADCPKPLVL